MTTESDASNQPKDNDVPMNDNSSVMTTARDNVPKKELTEKKEIVLKIMVKPKSTANASDIAKGHYSLLRAMTEHFDESIEVFDNHGKVMKDLKTPSSVDKYLRHFQLHFVKENKAKNMSDLIRRSVKLYITKEGQALQQYLEAPI